MNKIYKVVWNAARNCYVVGSEFISKTRRGGGYRGNVTTAGTRTLLAVCAACGISFYSGGLAVAADNLQTEPTIVIEVQEQKNEAVQPELLYSQLAAASASADALDTTMPADVSAAAEDTSEAPAVDVTSQHSVHDENGYYVYNGTENDTYNSLTKDGLWVGGVDDKTGFHVDNTGHASANGLDVQHQKITGVADGEFRADSTDAVTAGQLYDAGIVPGKAADGSVAIGNGSNVTNINGVAIGNKALVNYSVENGVAIGQGAEVRTDNATAIGQGSRVVSGDGSVALGQGSMVTATDAKGTDAHGVVSVGLTGNKVKEGFTRRIINVADGINDSDAATYGQVKDVQSSVTALDNLAVKYDTADKTSVTFNRDNKAGSVLNNVNDIVMQVETYNPSGKVSGYKSLSFKEAGIIPGTVSGDDNTDSVVIGRDSKSSKKHSVVVGDGARTLGMNATAIGTGASAEMDSSVAIGSGSQVGTPSAVNGTAVGAGSKVTAKNGTAVGQGAFAWGTDSTVLGASARVERNADGSVALGKDSYAKASDILDSDTKGVVSVGKSGNNGFTRRIINVADGVNDSDAATVKQVKAVQGDVDELNELAVTYTDNTKKAVNFNGATLKNVGDIQIGTAQSTFVGSGLVNGKVYDTGAGQWVENGANATHSMAVGSKSSVRGKDSIAVGPEATVNNGNSVVLEQSTAVGSKATVTSRFSTALGANTQATGDYSVAIGAQSRATVANATAIGAYAAAGENSVVVGGGKELAAPVVSRSNGTAMGTYVDIKSDNGTALGYGSQIGWDGKNSVALGADSVANEENVVSVGHTKGQTNGFGGTYEEDLNRRIINVADGTIAEDSHDAVTGGQLYTTNQNVADNADKLAVYEKSGIEAGAISGKTTSQNLAIGQNSKIAADGNVTHNVAIGNGATVEAGHDYTDPLKPQRADNVTYATAVGAEAKATGNGSTVYGAGSSTSSDYSTAIGRSAKAGQGAGDKATALGYNAQATDGDTLAAGANSKAWAAGSVALGADTTVNYGADNSVALGTGSKVFISDIKDSDVNGVVSVGSNGGERRIINVADGVNATDAATVGQISKITGMDSEKGNVVQYDGEDKAAVTFAGTEGTALKNVSDIELKGNSFVDAGLVAGTTTTKSTLLGNATAENNMILGDGAEIYVQGALGKAASVENSMAIGQGAEIHAQSQGSAKHITDSIAFGQDSYVSASNSVAIGAGSTATEEGVVSVGSANNQRRIVNVADGNIGENSIDAVNGSQLYAVREGAVSYGTKMEEDMWGNEKEVTDYSIVTLRGENGTKLTNLADGEFKADSTDAVTAGQLYAAGITPGDTRGNAGSVAMGGGYNNYVLGNNGTAIGYNALANENAVAIGNSAGAGHLNATAVGQNSNAMDEGATALGQHAWAEVKNATAIGFNSDVAFGGDNSVALGANTQVVRQDILGTDTHGVVSVGYSGKGYGDDEAFNRRIINVADGINDSDAATFGQVKDVQDSVKALDASAVQYDSVSKSTVTFDGTNGTALKNVSDIVMNTKDFYSKDAQFSFQDAGLLPGDVQSLGNKWNMAIGEGSAVKVEEGTTGSKMQMNTVVGNKARITQVLVDDEYQDVEKSTALGQGVTVAASNAVGVGQGSNVRGEGGVAVGMQANVSAKSGVAVGKQSKVSSDYSIAIGGSASVGSKSENSVAMGYNASSLAAGGTAIGQGAKVQGSAANGTAIGKGAIVNVNAGNSVALGASSQVQTADIGSDTEYGVVSVGKSGTNGFTRRIVNVADGLNDSDAATVGQLNAMQSAYTDSGIVGGTMDKYTLATGAVAIGKDSNVHGTGSIAIGTGSKVEQHNSVAIGRNAIVKGAGSVALGASSVATEDNVLSLGRNDGSLGLRIVNMKDGINERDAVTVGQMNALALGDRNGSLSLANGATNLADGIDRNTTAIKSLDEQLADATVDWEEGTQNMKDLTAKASAFAAQTQNVDWNALNSVDWNAVNAMAAVPATMNLAIDDAQANEGTGAEKDDDDRSPQTNGSNPGKVDGNLHVSGNTTLDGTLNVKGDATFEGNATFDKGATMKGDLNMSGNKITGLGAGDVSADSTDAVNGSQLFDVQQQVSDNRNAIGALGSRVSDLGEEVDSVGAISAALAGLHPLDYNGTGSKFQISAALGTYDGTQAAAIGGFYHFNRDTLLSIGGSTSFEGDRKTAANVGVTFRVGEGASEAPAVQDNETKQQMEAMKQEIEMLKAELEQLKNKDTEGTNAKN